MAKKTQKICEINELKVCKVSKVGDQSRGRPEGSLFNSYYTKVPFLKSLG